ncbi:adenylate cyclase [Pelomyxa schiedti]|nr:adenylate cyclase [Pelomyxa schiedti]
MGASEHSGGSASHLSQGWFSSSRGRGLFRSSRKKCVVPTWLVFALAMVALLLFGILVPWLVSWQISSEGLNTSIQQIYTQQSLQIDSVISNLYYSAADAVLSQAMPSLAKDLPNNGSTFYLSSKEIVSTVQTLSWAIVHRPTSGSGGMLGVSDVAGNLAGADTRQGEYVFFLNETTHDFSCYTMSEDYADNSYTISDAPFTVINPVSMTVTDSYKIGVTLNAAPQWTQPQPEQLTPTCGYYNLFVAPITNSRTYFVWESISTWFLLDSALKKLEPTPKSFLFVIDPEGYLISHSRTNADGTPLHCGGQGLNQWRIKADNCTHYVTVQAMGRIKEKYGSDFGDLFNMTKIPPLQIDSFWIYFVPESDQYGMSWVVISMLSKDDYQNELKKSTIIVFAVGSSVIIVALLIAIVMAYVIGHPLNKMSRAMVEVSRLERTSSMSTPRSFLAEVQNISEAFSLLKKGMVDFTKYLPTEVIRTLLATSSEAHVSLSQKTAGVIFVDIVGFTSLTEELPPELVSVVVNEFFQETGVVITEHGGVIDKYIGDCVMSLWNLPIARQNYVSSMLLALVALENISLNLRGKWKQHPVLSKYDAITNFSFRAGAATGKVLVGNVGCSMRLNYTVLGKSVNTASRIESLGRDIGVRSMVTGQAFAEPGNIPEGVILRRLGLVRCKGMSNACVCWEVFSDTGNHRSLCDTTNEITTAIHDQADFEDIRDLIDRAVTRFPADGFLAYLLSKSKDIQEALQKGRTWEIVQVYK